MNDLLKLLEHNARYTDAQLAAMLDTTEEEIRAQIAALEKQGVIRGYTAIVDWEKTQREEVSARIEVRAAPKRNRGFEEVAEQIAQFEEVESLCLVSGNYDLAMIVNGKTFQEIANFVAYRLAPMESILSTSTNFVMRTYKDKGIPFVEQKDERRVVL